MTVPFNKIEAGLERARIRQVEWRQVLAHARPDSEQAAKARATLEYYDTFLIAETKLLAYLRRRWRLYGFFPNADKPEDLLRQFRLWTGPAPGKEPPKQFRLPL
jgi:hypothetical protein